MSVKKFIQNIFSVRNKDFHKVITILGIKIKFKHQKDNECKKISELENKIKNLSKNLKEQEKKNIDLEKTINNQKTELDKLQNNIEILGSETLKINQTAEITELAMLKTKYHWDNIKIPQIKNNFQTIEELKNTNKSIIRFGNGDFDILKGNSMPYQKYDKYIADTLKTICYENDENLMTGIPEPYYDFPIELVESSKRFILNWFPKWHKIIEKYINYEKIYYSTHISQAFPVYRQYDFKNHYNNLKEIWNNKKITVITGDRVYNNIEHNIFENAESINYIYGPTENAFDEYENLKNRIFNTEKDNILIFALGPAGKVLAYDMYKAGYRVLDLGHIIKDYDFYKKTENKSQDYYNKCRKKFFDKD